MTLASFFLILIFASALYLLISPMVLDNSTSAPHAQNHIENLNYRKKEILESLKEFELDRNMQKISQEDYQSLYQETFVEGTKILKEIEERESAPISTNKMPPASMSKGTSSGVASPKFCSQCGVPLLLNVKFCSQCGHKIQGT